MTSVATAPSSSAAADPLHGRRVYLDSLGCAKNLVDSEATLGLLLAAGARVVDDPLRAEILLVNTCGFLEAARQESIDRILELAQHKSYGDARLLAVLGCLVARAPDVLADEIPEVDVWLPAGRHGDLPARLRALLDGRPAETLRRATDRSGSGRAPQGAFHGFGSRVLLTPAHTAYLKISEGCTNACSFCSIPLMRGTQRSRPLDDLVREAGALAQRGVRELHLVAQDLTHWGFDLAGRPDLLDLARSLAAVEGIEWIRLLYAHPKHMTSRILQGIFSIPKVTRYLDMPIQHASDPVLRGMRRPYTARHVLEQLRWLRERVPGITLRSTVIVGFPGEKESDFRTLCRFVDQVRYERLGIFTYSREPGTAAYDLAGRPRASTALRRMQELADLQLHIAAAASERRIGTRQRVLIDATPPAAGDEAQPELASGCVASGRTEAEALDVDGSVWIDPGELPAAELVPGRFVDVEITAADVYDVRGRALALESPGGASEAVVALRVGPAASPPGT